MKRILLLLAIAWFGALVPRTQAAELTVDLFYDQLAPYGDWVDAGDYGYAWHPRDVGEDWRPYTEGRWAYTDAGWTFLSEEPYSWAVYHYGRWTKVNDVGWIWVPGREWGPAWVSFRRSNHYVGWAPLPPEASFGREVSTISSWSDSYYNVGPTQYSFVEVRNFGAPRLRQYIAPPRENVTIITETTNITNIRFENNTVYNGGPDYNVITRESAQPIQRLRLERRSDVVVSDRNSFRSTVQGDSLRIAAPTFQSSSTTVVAPKNVRRLERVEVNHGWRDAGDPAATEKVRAKMQAEAKVPASLPPKPTFQKASATAAGGATEAPASTTAPASTQPGRTPPTTAETAATPAPKAPVTGNEKATSSTKPNSRSQSPAATDPNSSTPTATSTEKSATPQPTAKTAKGKKGQRMTATPAPTAATEPNSAPTAVAPEKPVAPQPGDLPPKGKKGQRTPPATSAARNESPTATPPGQKSRPQRDDSAPGVTPSRPARPESATEAPVEKPQPPAEKPAPKTHAKQEVAPANQPTERAPEAKPQRKEQKAPPAEMEKRPNPAADRAPEARQRERAPEGADARPKERAPEAPKARQPAAEPQSAAPRGPAPQAPGHDKGQKKEDKKDDKKPEGAPQ